MLSTGHLVGFCNLWTYGGPQGWGQGEDKPIKWESQSEPCVVVLSLPSSYVWSQLWRWICVSFLPCDEHLLHLCFKGGKKSLMLLQEHVGAFRYLDLWVHIYLSNWKTLETRWKGIYLSRSIKLKTKKAFNIAMLV